MLQETVNEYNIPLLTGTIDVVIENNNKNYFLKITVKCVCLLLFDPTPGYVSSGLGKLG